VRCSRFLPDICGRLALLPRLLAIPLHFGPTENPLRRGVDGRVWKGQYNGREVVVKVLRVYPASDVGKIRKAGCPRLVACVGELTASCIAVLQGRHDMEGPPSSECAAAVRRVDDRESLRDGIRVDGQWEHQSICEGGYRRRLVGTRVFFVPGPYFHLPLTIDGYCS
jgi:hypothetical protein